MNGRILVEFYSTCPDCRGAESIAQAVCSDPAWSHLTEFAVYRRDEDPKAGDPGLRVSGPTVVVDRTTVVISVGAYAVRRALEDALARRTSV